MKYRFFNPESEAGVAAFGAGAAASSEGAKAPDAGKAEPKSESRGYAAPAKMPSKKQAVPAAAGGGSSGESSDEDDSEVSDTELDDARRETSGKFSVSGDDVHGKRLAAVPSGEVDSSGADSGYKDVRPSSPSASGVSLFGVGAVNLLRKTDKTSLSMFEGTKLITQKLIDAMRAHGRTIEVVVKGSDEYRYLEAMGAEASINTGLPNHILIKEDANCSTLIEEFLHGVQHKLGIIDRLGVQGAEVHVKQFMLRHAKMLGLDNPADLELLKQLYVEELDRLPQPSKGGLDR